MKITLVSDIHHLPVNRNEWNTLASLNQTNTPFQTFEWFTSWWKIFGGENQLYLLLIYEGTHLVALAPLMLQRSYNKKMLSFISDVNADYCDLIIGHGNKESVLNLILDYLVRHHDQWDSLSLRNIPEHSNTTTLIKRYCSKNNLHLIESSISCPVLSTGGPQDTSRMKTSRTIRRHMNYFNKNGGVTFNIFESLEDAENVLDLFFEQHIQRWGLINQPSLFCDVRYQKFYRELLHNAWSTGWLFFSSLQFNNKPIAFHFGLDHNAKVYWYKPSFDIAFRKRSPGKILINHLIEYCIHNNKTEFDFTLGDEPFKKEYTNTIRNNTNLRIFTKRTNYIMELLQRKSKKIIKYLLRTFTNNNQ
jgi:CelD/BcsL family acetyltransferase involved in cellulose biosynthesis